MIDIDIDISSLLAGNVLMEVAYCDILVIVCLFVCYMTIFNCAGVHDTCGVIAN